MLLGQTVDKVELKNPLTPTSCQSNHKEFTFPPEIGHQLWHHCLCRGRNKKFKKKKSKFSKSRISWRHHMHAYIAKGK